MRIIAALVLILCLSWPGFAVQPKKHSSSHAAASQKKKGKRRPATRKSLAQTAPTPARYQEIQQALATKGYGPRTPNGIWDPEWASALKRYQQDQKLEATGKLTSLSLITLGLGPRRDQPAGAAAPPALPGAARPALPGATAPPAPPAANTPAPPGASAPPAPPGPALPPVPSGATAPSAPPADQPPSSSSTVRELK